MTFNDLQRLELAKPLSAGNVASRTQSGRKLSYLEGWHVIAEANRIFGFDGWTRETVEMREVRPPELVKSQNGKETWRVGFVARVRVTVGDVVREGTGFGSGALPDMGDAYESAVKEAETDAMKRALMTFGNQFGLALYDKEQANVTHEVEHTAAAPAHPAKPLAPPTQPELPPPEQKPTSAQMKLFGRMALDIKGLRSLQAVSDWVKNPVNDADFQDLPASLQTSLKRQLAEQRHALEAEAPA